MSRATPYGYFNVADVAGPLSPLNDAVPSPAIMLLVYVPVAVVVGVSFRICLVPELATYTLPIIHE